MLFEHKGKLASWQDFASGKAIVEQFGSKASEIRDEKIWHKIAENIAIGLIDLIASLTPEIVIIGGGVGEYFDKFAEPLNQILNSYKTNMITIPPVQQAKRPTEAVIYGCYEYGKANYNKSSN